MVSMLYAFFVELSFLIYIFINILFEIDDADVKSAVSRMQQV